MKFSVVIATRDRAALLDGALRSLATQVGAPEIEAVVVDNGSTDTTREVAAAYGAVYVFEAAPNRARARNAGVARASGEIVLFVDDDVVLPPFFVAAHARAHAAQTFPHVVTGPIINVPSAEHRPVPSFGNASNAFFCTCNASVPRNTLQSVGGFDESFDKYGWEDTELGARLRRFDVRRIFAWDAYLWHIKPPTTETLDAALLKTIEKARMAAKFVRKDTSARSSRPAPTPRTACARNCSRPRRRKRGSRASRPAIACRRRWRASRAGSCSTASTSTNSNARSAKWPRACCSCDSTGSATRSCARRYSKRCAPPVTRSASR
jgi:glycosyltransferase involved in cell wall biosynthesis